MSYVGIPLPDQDGVRRYGVLERPEDPKRCRAERSVGDFTSQCRRRRGHGPDGAFCSQHASFLRPQQARQA